jgi:putative colanic acid biosynthesis acetyltransferase WcaF
MDWISRALLLLDYVANHVINRIPLVGVRMRAYSALGVAFDAPASTNIGLGVEVWSARGLSIGARSTIGQRSYIDARGGVRIDSDVSISRGVMVMTAEHVVDDPDFGATLAPVHFEPRSWVGAGAVVLPGVRVGEGAVVAAGAVVTKDVASYVVVAGSPARPIGTRPGPMRYELDFRPSWW